MGENPRLMGSIYVPKFLSDILIEVSMIPDFSMKLSKLDYYLDSFEEEMTKIDAFKRELPFCMQLLKEAIETLKKERVQWRERDEITSEMEGFMERRAKWSINLEKRNWMSSAQLWTTPIQYENTLDLCRKQESIVSSKLRYGISEEENSLGKRGGTVMPFQRLPGVEMEKRSVAIPVGKMDLNVKEGWGFRLRATVAQQKKERRCWSPELHKRFLDALQNLGGPNTATPKQIRAVMNVDGLTNDQVKSHLQKYRLHMRKLPSSLARTTGYSWLRQDHATQEPSKRMAGRHSGSGSPQDHLNSGKPQPPCDTLQDD